MPRVTELYAYVAADTGPDDEGVPAFIDPLTGAWMPMMGADRERAESLRAMAQRLADASGKPIKLLRAVELELIDTITPA
jgi:hypothetical protein